MNKWLVRVIGIAALLSAGLAQATPITVTNGDFENFSTWNTDWTPTGNVGWQPLSGLTNFYTVDLAPYQLGSVFGNGAGQLSQTLTGTTLQTNTTYTLTVAVGNRNNLALPGYGIELWAGATKVASEYSITQGGTGLDPADGTWSNVTATFTTFVSVVAGDLEIVLKSYGVQVNYDNVSLDARPATDEEIRLAELGALISIPNANFEVWKGSWTNKTGDVGWQPAPTTTGYTDDLAPYGDWLIFGNNGLGQISQTLTGTTLQTNTTYTLTVAVGNRNNLALPGYGIELWAGATKVASEYSITQGGTGLDPADGTWSNVTATVTSGGSVVAGDLKIVLQSYGTQVNYDNVSLRARPATDEELEANFPLLIESTVMNGSGHFEVTVGGLRPGTEYKLMKSTDLVAGSFDVEADSVTAVSGTETMIDTNAPAGRAFYKVSN